MATAVYATSESSDVEAEAEDPLVSLGEVGLFARRAGILSLDAPSSAFALSLILEAFLKRCFSSALSAQTAHMAAASSDSVASLDEFVLNALECPPLALDGAGEALGAARAESLGLALDEPIHLRQITNTQVPSNLVASYN